MIDDAVTWDQVVELVRASAGNHLESVRFVDQYRGQQIPAGKKSYVIGLYQFTYCAAPA